MKSSTLPLAVSVFAVLACGGGGGKRTSKATPPPTPYGERAQIGETTIVVHGSRDRSQVGNKFVNHQAPEGATLRAIDLSVTNTGKEPLAMAGRVLLLGDGTKYFPTEGCMFAMKDSFRMLEPLNPGITKRGKVCFEVPKDVGALKVGVKPGLLGAPVEFLDGSAP